MQVFETLVIQVIALNVAQPLTIVANFRDCAQQGGRSDDFPALARRLYLI
jgi:hypothetical protein